MILGGIPHYLERILPGESVAQTVDRLFFTETGFLRTEFDNVFASLFDHYDNHEKIIKALASVRKGLTRTEILKKSNVKSGGTLTNTLSELEESGFIENYLPYRGTKDSLFRLSDEYSMFYIKYVEKSRASGNGVWTNIHRRQSYRSWAGFSFETICTKHIDQIKEGLGISGINSTYGSWIERKAQTNAQIDLLLDRDDNVINLFEMKFYNTEFTIDKKYAGELAKKIHAFSTSTKTKKNIFVTFITSYGVKQNQYSTQYVQNELTLNHLFKAL